MAETGALRELTIELGDRKVVMTYRDGTKDRFTLEENWLKHPYRLNQHPDVARRQAIDEAYARIVEEGRTPLIVDAGANIGASALFFAWRYPAARILALEPEASNAALLRRNAAPYPQVLALEAAIASEDGELQVIDPGRSTDAFRTTKADPSAEHGAVLGSVPAYSVATLIREFAPDAVPLLAKIDIEGGEADLFSAHTEWVEAFPAIAIELHDWLFPGQATSAPFLRCVAERGRDFIVPYTGDVVFSLRNPAA